MSSNPYKAFIPYIVPVGSARLIGDLVEEKDMVSEPSGGDWRRVGLTAPVKGEDIVISTEGGSMMAVQFNERMLPGKVRDEHMAKEVTRLERLQGRKLSKKEYAQLREQAEFDLLPKAFIRRTVVPIFFVRDYLLVCTSSQKRADDAVAILQAVAGPDWAIHKADTAQPMIDILTALAQDSLLVDEDEDFDGSHFMTHDSAVLKGENKKVIRIKDKPVDDKDIQQLLTEGYEVHELGLAMGDLDILSPEDSILTFVVNKLMTFKRLDLRDVSATKQDANDVIGFAVLAMQSYKRLLDTWFKEVGGRAAAPAPASTTDTSGPTSNVIPAVHNPQDDEDDL